MPINGGGVAVRLGAGGVAGFAGLASCGSVWADPVCNAKIMARRALEIGAAVALWQAQGGQVYLVTLTLRHHAGQRLATLWDAVSHAWGRTTMGKPWAADRARFGIAGYARALEVTWGRHGWHPHLHVLLFAEAGHRPEPIALHGRMFERWSRALGRQGMAALSIAQDVKVISGPADDALASYLTKSMDHAGVVGLEVTWSQGKAARTVLSTVTPWSFLDGVQYAGDADDLDRWHEWEQASKGRRMHTWSQGIRDRLGLMREETDEEIAATEIGTEDDDLVLISADGWAQLVREPADLAALLDVAERAGLHGVRAFLDGRRIDYTVRG